MRPGTDRRPSHGRRWPATAVLILAAAPVVASVAYAVPRLTRDLLSFIWAALPIATTIIVWLGLKLLLWPKFGSRRSAPTLLRGEALAGRVGETASAPPHDVDPTDEQPGRPPPRP
jgi:hypothetical protein